jgi:hypothetical protein
VHIRREARFGSVRLVRAGAKGCRPAAHAERVHRPPEQVEAVRVRGRACPVTEDGRHRLDVEAREAKRAQARGG